MVHKQMKHKTTSPGGRQVYHDEALASLTEQYPVSEVMGRSEETWRTGEIDGLKTVAVFNSSPTQNSVFEIEIGTLCHNAAREGKWVGVDTGWDEQGLADFELCRSGPAGGKSMTKFGRGLDAALKAEFVDLKKQDGKVFLTPNENTVKFIQQKLGPYR